MNTLENLNIEPPAHQDGPGGHDGDGARGSWMIPIQPSRGEPRRSRGQPGPSNPLLRPPAFDIIDQVDCLRTPRCATCAKSRAALSSRLPAPRSTSFFWHLRVCDRYRGSPGETAGSVRPADGTAEVATCCGAPSTQRAVALRQDLYPQRPRAQAIRRTIFVCGDPRLVEDRPLLDEAELAIERRCSDLGVQDQRARPRPRRRGSPPPSAAARGPRREGLS